MGSNLSVGLSQKEPPLFEYEMCIGVLKTLNLYWNACVRHRVIRSVFLSPKTYCSSYSSCHVPLPVMSSQPICFVISLSENRMARFE